MGLRLPFSLSLSFFIRSFGCKRRRRTTSSRIERQSRATYTRRGNRGKKSFFLSYPPPRARERGVVIGHARRRPPFFLLLRQSSMEPQGAPAARRGIDRAWLAGGQKLRRASTPPLQLTVLFPPTTTKQADGRPADARGRPSALAKAERGRDARVMTATGEEEVRVARHDGKKLLLSYEYSAQAPSSA